MFRPFVTSLPLKCNDRLINGLFHSRCLDFHANEKIIILKLALSVINYADRTTRFIKIRDGKNILIQLLILREYICFA